MLGESQKHRKKIHEVHKNVVPNEYYPHDITDITRPTCNIMRVIGAWPPISEERTSWEKVYKLFLIVVSYALLSCNLISGLSYWLTQANMIMRIRMSPFLLFETMTLGQYTIFIFRDDQIKQCLRHIEEDWRKIVSADVRSIMLRFVQTGKRLVKICAVLMYSSAVFFRTILPLSEGDIVIQNVTIRPMACPSYIFFVDLQATPVYETFFTIQCFSGLITASITIGACGLTAIFVMHASGQLRILQDLMMKLVENQWRKEREVDLRFSEIVEHQIRVRSFLHLVQRTLQQIFLMEIMVNTITLCIITYFIIIEWENNNMAGVCVYLLCIGDITIHIFLFCYTGEQLTVQAGKVATVSCELEWYRLPNKKARYIVLLMIMSNAPTKVSAGNLFDLSLRTFGNAMKAAGAYVNMLRNVT